MTFVGNLGNDPTWPVVGGVCIITLRWLLSLQPNIILNHATTFLSCHKLCSIALDISKGFSAIYGPSQLRIDEQDDENRSGEFTLPHIKVIPIHTKQREKD